MEFIERRAEADNDPVFGRVGEANQFFQRRNPRASRQPLPPSLDATAGTKTTTMALQVDPNNNNNFSSNILVRFFRNYLQTVYNL